MRDATRGKWLETPEGWARAGLLLATLRDPPTAGSLRESVLTYYMLMKERIEHAKIRAVVQGMIDKDKGVEVFEDYMKTAFPWIATATRREKDSFIKVLQEEIKRTHGALQITAAHVPKNKVRSRLKERAAEQAPAPANRDTEGIYGWMNNRRGGLRR